MFSTKVASKMIQESVQKITVTDEEQRLCVGEVVEEDRKAFWESGNYDYMGEDSFEKIQKKIESKSGKCFIRPPISSTVDVHLLFKINSNQNEYPSSLNQVLKDYKDRHSKNPNDNLIFIIDKQTSVKENFSNFKQEVCQIEEGKKEFEELFLPKHDNYEYLSNIKKYGNIAYKISCVEKDIEVDVSQKPCIENKNYNYKDNNGFKDSDSQTADQLTPLSYASDSQMQQLPIHCNYEYLSNIDKNKYTHEVITEDIHNEHIERLPAKESSTHKITRGQIEHVVSHAQHSKTMVQASETISARDGDAVVEGVCFIEGGDPVFCDHFEYKVEKIDKNFEIFEFDGDNEVKEDVEDFGDYDEGYDVHYNMQSLDQVIVAPIDTTQLTKTKEATEIQASQLEDGIVRDDTTSLTPLSYTSDSQMQQQFPIHYNYEYFSNIDENKYIHDVTNENIHNEHIERIPSKESSTHQVTRNQIEHGVSHAQPTRTMVQASGTIRARDDDAVVEGVWFIEANDPVFCDHFEYKAEKIDKKFEIFDFDGDNEVKENVEDYGVHDDNKENDNDENYDKDFGNYDEGYDVHYNMQSLDQVIVAPIDTTKLTKTKEATEVQAGQLEDGIVRDDTISLTPLSYTSDSQMQQQLPIHCNYEYLSDIDKKKYTHDVKNEKDNSFYDNIVFDKNNLSAKTKSEILSTINIDVFKEESEEDNKIDEKLIFETTTSKDKVKDNSSPKKKSLDRVTGASINTAQIKKTKEATEVQASQLEDGIVRDDTISLTPLSYTSDSQMQQQFPIHYNYEYFSNIDENKYTHDVTNENIHNEHIEKIPSKESSTHQVTRNQIEHGVSHAQPTRTMVQASDVGTMIKLNNESELFDNSSKPEEYKAHFNIDEINESFFETTLDVNLRTDQIPLENSVGVSLITHVECIQEIYESNTDVTIESDSKNTDVSTIDFMDKSENNDENKNKKEDTDFKNTKMNEKDSSMNLTDLTIITANESISKDITSQISIDFNTNSTIVSKASLKTIPSEIESPPKHNINQHPNLSEEVFHGNLHDSKKENESLKICLEENINDHDFRSNEAPASKHNQDSESVVMFQNKNVEVAGIGTSNIMYEKNEIYNESLDGNIKSDIKKTQKGHTILDSVKPSKSTSDVIEDEDSIGENDEMNCAKVSYNKRFSNIDIIKEDIGNILFSNDSRPDNVNDFFSENIVNVEKMQHEENVFEGSEQDSCSLSTLEAKKGLFHVTVAPIQVGERKGKYKMLSKPLQNSLKKSDLHSEEHRKVKKIKLRDDENSSNLSVISVKHTLLNAFEKNETCILNSKFHFAKNDNFFVYLGTEFILPEFLDDYSVKEVAIESHTPLILRKKISNYFQDFNSFENTIFDKTEKNEISIEIEEIKNSEAEINRYSERLKLRNNFKKFLSQQKKVSRKLPDPEKMSRSSGSLIIHGRSKTNSFSESFSSSKATSSSPSSYLFSPTFDNSFHYISSPKRRVLSPEVPVYRGNKLILRRKSVKSPTISNIEKNLVKKPVAINSMNNEDLTHGSDVILKSDELLQENKTNKEEEIVETAYKKHEVISEVIDEFSDFINKLSETDKTNSNNESIEFDADKILDSSSPIKTSIDSSVFGEENFENVKDPHIVENEKSFTVNDEVYTSTFEYLDPNVVSQSGFKTLSIENYQGKVDNNLNLFDENYKKKMNIFFGEEDKIKKSKISKNLEESKVDEKVENEFYSTVEVFERETIYEDIPNSQVHIHKNDDVLLEKNEILEKKYQIEEIEKDKIHNKVVKEIKIDSATSSELYGEKYDEFESENIFKKTDLLVDLSQNKFEENEEQNETFQTENTYEIQKIENAMQESAADKFKNNKSVLEKNFSTKFEPVNEINVTKNEIHQNEESFELGVLIRKNTAAFDFNEKEKKQNYLNKNSSTKKSPDLINKHTKSQLLIGSSKDLEKDKASTEVEKRKLLIEEFTFQNEEDQKVEEISIKNFENKEWRNYKIDRSYYYFGSDKHPTKSHTIYSGSTYSTFEPKQSLYSIPNDIRNEDLQKINENSAEKRTNLPKDGASNDKSFSRISSKHTDKEFAIKENYSIEKLVHSSLESYKKSHQEENKFESFSTGSSVDSGEVEQSRFQALSFVDTIYSSKNSNTIMVSNKMISNLGNSSTPTYYSRDPKAHEWYLQASKNKKERSQRLLEASERDIRDKTTQNHFTDYPNEINEIVEQLATSSKHEVINKELSPLISDKTSNDATDSLAESKTEKNLIKKITKIFKNDSEELLLKEVFESLKNTFSPSEKQPPDLPHIIQEAITSPLFTQRVSISSRGPFKTRIKSNITSLNIVLGVSHKKNK